jgi:hypothetical protein
MSSIWNLRAWINKGWTLENTSQSRLCEERVELDNRARRLLNDLARLEEEKLRLEDAYVEASRMGQRERKELIAHECRKVEWELEELPARYSDLVKKMTFLRRWEHIKEDESALHAQGRGSVLTEDPDLLKQALVSHVAGDNLRMLRMDEMLDIMNERNRRPQDASLKAVRRRLDELATQRLAQPADGSTIDRALDAIDLQLDELGTSPVIGGKAVQ